jgi:hypothetical protein
MDNPYDRHGDGRAAWRIKEHLKQVPLDAGVLKKPFRDARPGELA